jgi:hypothetical protein
MTAATGFSSRRGPWWNLVLGALLVLGHAGLGVALGSPLAYVGIGVGAWIMSYAIGSTAWAFAASVFALSAVAFETEDLTLLGLSGTLTLLAIVQAERSISMRRNAQADRRVRRAGIVMIALVLLVSFLLIGIVQLITSDQVASFQVPLGLTITAAIVATVARLLDRADDTSNAHTFRPGARH